jgi:hypothetical protein
VDSTPFNDQLQAIKDLRGKHLLCWCRQEQPYQSWCHARVWLGIVNRPEGKP